jgi:hypothetical protein
LRQRRRSTDHVYFPVDQELNQRLSNGWIRKSRGRDPRIRRRASFETTRSSRFALQFGKGLPQRRPAGGRKNNCCWHWKPRLASGRRSACFWSCRGETQKNARHEETENFFMSTIATQIDSETLRSQVVRFREVQAEIVRQVHRVIVGQEEVLEQVMIALFVGGHCLITGLRPARRCWCGPSRTRWAWCSSAFSSPDLMPSDITGTDIIEEDQASGRARGPSCQARFSPTFCWPMTRSTALRPRRNRRC